MLWKWSDCYEMKRWAKVCGSYKCLRYVMCAVWVTVSVLIQSIGRNRLSGRKADVVVWRTFQRLDEMGAVCTEETAALLEVRLCVRVHA